MFGIKKLKVLIWSATISLLLFSCQEIEHPSITITGETQGTTYTVIIVEDEVDVDKTDLDNLFTKFDNSLSTYIPNSVISKINSTKDSISIVDESGYLQTCFNQSMQVYTSTNGAFDPSVYPLVEGWGFMSDMTSPLDSSQVDSLVQFVSFKRDSLYSIQFVDQSITFNKSNEGFKMDFNAIAQGLSVDVVDDYLKGKGYNNYYIEIGGELIVRGTNREGVDWKIGVDSPIENQKTRELENVINVSDVAIATSGNYRKFYEKDGVKYAHTINPKTGWPVTHRLLSATVVAPKCALADGYATAFMVLGKEATMGLLDELDQEIEVYLIYTDASGELKREYSEGFEKYL